MLGSFFSNPLWQNFQNCKVRVVSLSEPEHRLRDALALMCLRDFLPPRRRSCERVTIDGPEPPQLPALQEGDGLVLLGRPSLFGRSCLDLIRKVSPPLLYSFCSDRSTERTPYRTIAGPLGPLLESEPYDRLRGQGRTNVDDCAIVYAGWKGRIPIMILAGTSTVGTWGAAEYAVSDVEGVDDVRWQREIQGVVRASVSSRVEAFEQVTVDVVELVAPARIWMQGNDLPPWDGWRRLVGQTEGRGGAKGKFDLDILVNGQKVAGKATTFLPALILLAWIGDPNRRGFRAGHFARTTVGEISARLDAFFGKRCVELAYINATLKSLTRAIRAKGGIAHIDKNDNGDDRYCVCARKLPAFLANWQQ
jgi:hypothetical protein